MVFTLLENALNLGIFTHASSPVKTIPQVLIITSPDRGNLLIPTRQRFLKNLFQPTAERGRGNYDLLQKI